MTVRVDVISDVICPWCFVAKRRMDKAIATFAGTSDIDIDVTWHPFELNPDMPKDGMDRKVYRSQKFGSWERSLALDAQVARAGKDDGIAFAHARAERTPNTFDAHRLLWLAQQKGVQDRVAEALFRGYFIEGVDVGRREELVTIARDAGLDAEETRLFLDSDGGAAEVRAEEVEHRLMGVSGVPLIIVNGTAVISGAQRPDTFLAAFEEAVREETRRAADTVPIAAGGVCALDGTGQC